MGESSTINAGASHAGDLRVLMISIDPGLLDEKVGTGDVLERHRKYASRVTSLDIIVLGGDRAAVKEFGNLTVQSTGVKGLKGLFAGLHLARRVARLRQAQLIVTQDPHATGWIGMRLKQELHIPLLVDMHGDFLQNDLWLRESWRHRVYATFQQRILHAADRVRVVSYGIEEKALQIGLTKQKLAVLHTPINDTAFRELDEHQKILLEELRFKYQGKKVIIFCGRLVPAKNLPFLLECMSQLKKQREDWILLIIGQGDQEERLQAQIEKSHLASQVQLMGAKTQKELAVYYRAGSFLVLPSTNESFGKVIIEAGIAGLPSLATATTGASHIIIDGKTGFLVPLGDREAFVEVMVEMLEYPEQTKQLGDWARERYSETYAAAETIDHIIGLWREVARV